MSVTHPRRTLRLLAVFDVLRFDVHGRQRTPLLISLSALEVTRLRTFIALEVTRLRTFTALEVTRLRAFTALEQAPEVPEVPEAVMDTTA